MAKLNPYLNFDGNCREAMTFYKNCLGGDLYLQTVKESPEMAAMMPPHLKDHILHSVLTCGDIVIMASDLNKEKPVNGNTYQLCIQCDSEDQLLSFFNGLSEGGTINDPIADMPWGAKFGAITDKFGKSWIFNWEKGKV